MRYRFMQDDDGHVYLIPAELREEFMRLEEEGYVDGNFQPFIDKFDQYRKGYSISAYSFTDPQED